jgi:hypothetical protein
MRILLMASLFGRLKDITKSQAFASQNRILFDNPVYAARTFCHTKEFFTQVARCALFLETGPLGETLQSALGPSPLLDR